ncbi:MAG: long-chain fatty acid--CoA ligase [Candidatus Staskawiczbacteria bacterium]|nr:long-chain fatty acid--CoA ligase [Candidatus Staskawiczbacteria bacterium]
MYKAIPEVFFETAKKFPKKSAFLYKKGGVYFPIAYKEAASQVKILGSALQKCGVNKGDKVAILSENRPEWAISDMAIMAAGGITVPLHTTLSTKAISNVLKHSEAKILIVSNSDFLNKVLLGQEHLKYLEKIVFLEKLTEAQKKNLTKKVLSWKAFFSLHKNEVSEKIFLDPDDVCSIIYTSGTTGTPKGVLLSHRNFLSNVEAINEIVPVKESDVFLSFLPLSHVLERTAGYYMPLCFGATIAYAESIKQLSVNLKEVKPTVLISVPRIFEKFHDAIWDRINFSNPVKQKIFKWALKQEKNTFWHRLADIVVFKKIKSLLGGKLRLTVSGGASLNENLGRFFLKIGILILEGYGLTETSPVISVNQENDFKFGAVGKIIPGVKVKIAETKEIFVKGPNIFKGYFKNRNGTKSAFDKDGWFHTGDLGFMDKQGFLTIIGREKEMIVTSGGKNIWPEPIENLLNNDRFIHQSMIVGDKNKFISALIVPDWQEVKRHMKEKNLPLKEPGKLARDPDILAVFQQRIDNKINPNLSEYEKIKKFKLLPQEFSQEQDELTPTLKLRRHIIENHYKKTIESFYS